MLHSERVQVTVSDVGLPCYVYILDNSRALHEMPSEAFIVFLVTKIFTALIICYHDTKHSYDETLAAVALERFFLAETLELRVGTMWDSFRLGGID